MRKQAGMKVAMSMTLISKVRIGSVGSGSSPLQPTCYPEAALGLSLGRSNLKAVGSVNSGLSP